MNDNIRYACLYECVVFNSIFFLHDSVPSLGESRNFSRLQKFTSIEKGNH